MGIIKDLFKAVKDNGPLITGILRVKHMHQTMTRGEREAYDAISKTATPDNKTHEVRCTIPAGIADADARKALQLMRLEYGSGWKVTAAPANKGGNAPKAPPKP